MIRSNRIKQSAAGRIVAAAMAAVILCVMLTASFCLTAQADHDCSGEHCAVCALLYQWGDMVRQVRSGISALTALLPAAAPQFFLLLLIAAAFLSATPVSKQVRLNN